MMMASVSRRHPSNAVGESSRVLQFLDLEAAVENEEEEEEVDPEEFGMCSGKKRTKSNMND